MKTSKIVLFAVTSFFVGSWSTVGEARDGYVGTVPDPYENPNQEQIVVVPEGFAPGYVWGYHGWGYDGDYDHHGYPHHGHYDEHHDGHHDEHHNEHHHGAFHHAPHGHGGGHRR